MRLQSILRALCLPAILALLVCPLRVWGQTTSTGYINATLINGSGIALIFDSNAGGVTLGGNASSAASLNFGTISAFGALSSGVTRPSVGANSFTVQSLFNVQVIEGGLGSPNYTLSAQLATTAPTGFTYQVDTISLSTTAQKIQSNGTYNTDVQHALNLLVSSAAPGAGGPAVGTPLTTTINFTATSN
ncbi:MAG: hypothetical protein ABSF45_26690 [Terriglobia bacterium]|jgi:hypothetical protein